MLIGFAGLMTGYNGSFAFAKPGDKLDNVTYVGMRTVSDNSEMYRYVSWVICNPVQDKHFSDLSSSSAACWVHHLPHWPTAVYGSSHTL